MRNDVGLNAQRVCAGPYWVSSGGPASAGGGVGSTSCEVEGVVGCQPAGGGQYGGSVPPTAVSAGADGDAGSGGGSAGSCSSTVEFVCFAVFPRRSLSAVETSLLLTRLALLTNLPRARVGRCSGMTSEPPEGY